MKNIYREFIEMQFTNTFATFLRKIKKSVDKTKKKLYNDGK